MALSAYLQVGDIWESIYQYTMALSAYLQVGEFICTYLQLLLNIWMLILCIQELVSAMHFSVQCPGCILSRTF